MGWKINNTETATAGVEIVGIRRGLPWEDSAVLRKVDSMLGSDFLTYGAAVEIKAPDNTIVFKGHVVSLPREAGGQEEAMVYRAAGLWNQLERTTYCQPAGFAHPDEDGNPSIDSDWTSKTWIGGNTADAISDILSFAHDHGCTLALGTAPTGYLVPTTERRDESCARCLLGLLGYHPEVTPWIDYTGNTLNFTASASLTAAALDLADGGVDDISVEPLHDAKPTRIVVVWTRRNAYPGGDVRMERQIEVADASGSRVYAPGEDATGETLLGPGIVRYTLDVEGGHATKSPQAEAVQTRPLPTEEDSETNQRKFWRANLPWLNRLIEDGVITSGAVKISQHKLAVLPPDPDADADPGGEVPSDWSTDIADYPRQLIAGGASPMLVRMGIEFAPVEAHAIIRIDPPVKDTDLTKWFGESGAEEFSASLQITGTDATSRVYRGLPGFEPGEDFPSAGLAARLYANASTLRYEGHVRLREAAAPVTILPGKRLTISGGESAWGTMLAPVWAVDISPETGTSTVRFGPPGTLRIQDYLELMRMFRQHGTEVTASYADRDEGKVAAGAVGGESRFFDARREPAGGLGRSRRGFELEAVKRADVWKTRIWPGSVHTAGVVLSMDGSKPTNSQTILEPTTPSGTLTEPREIDTGTVWLTIYTNAEGAADRAEITVGEPPEQSQHSPDEDTDGIYTVEIGTVSESGEVTQKTHGDVWFTGVGLSLEDGDSGSGGSGGQFEEISIVKSIVGLTATCSCSCGDGGSGGGSGEGDCSCTPSIEYYKTTIRIPKAWIIIAEDGPYHMPS